MTIKIPLLKQVTRRTDTPTGISKYTFEVSNWAQEDTARKCCAKKISTAKYYEYHRQQKWALKTRLHILLTSYLLTIKQDRSGLP